MTSTNLATDDRSAARDERDHSGVGRFFRVVDGRSGELAHWRYAEGYQDAVALAEEALGLRAHDRGDAIECLRRDGYWWAGWGFRLEAFDYQGHR